MRRQRRMFRRCRRPCPRCRLCRRRRCRHSLWRLRGMRPESRLYRRRHNRGCTRIHQAHLSPGVRRCHRPCRRCRLCRHRLNRGSRLGPAGSCRMNLRHRRCHRPHLRCRLCRHCRCLLTRTDRMASDRLCCWYRHRRCRGRLRWRYRRNRGPVRGSEWWALCCRWSSSPQSPEHQCR